MGTGVPKCDPQRLSLTYSFHTFICRKTKLLEDGEVLVARLVVPLELIMVLIELDNFT